MRIIVCGSREWVNFTKVNDVLDEILERAPYSLTVIHGACPAGADRWATEWCERKRQEGAPGEIVHEVRVHADWRNRGKAAGPIRNQEMADAGADLCLAFWNGESRGTLDMITRATKTGIPTRIVPPAKGGG